MNAEPESNTGRQPTPDARLRVAALTALQARVKSVLDDARTELHADMTNGESHTVWADAGEQVATVNRSKPRPKATVTNQTALDAWLVTNYPDECSEEVTVTAEGREYLADVAPELLDRRLVATEQQRNAVLKASEKARQAVHPDGTADVPGVSVDVGRDGTLTVKLGDEGQAQVERLVAEGRLSWSDLLPALPAGGQS